MTSFLRSCVIDIRSSSSKVEYTERSQLPGFEHGQRNWLALDRREKDREPLKIVACLGVLCEPREQSRAHNDRTATSQANRIRTRHGQRRDAVQRGRNRPQVLKSGGNMHKTL